MEFGYFFAGRRARDGGPLAAVVDVRPLERGPGQDAGARIVITMPLHTSWSALPVAELAARCLAQAEQLLPASQLTAWATQWPETNSLAPCEPADAAARWLAYPENF